MPNSVDTFKRLAAGVKPEPLPKFPAVPDEIKNRTPELREAWSRFESAIEMWVQKLQLTLQR